MRKKINHTNEGLLHGFQLSQEASFNEIFHELYHALYYYSFQITGDKASSQDIAEEAFIKAWERRERIHHLKSYLYRIVRNASLDWVEAEKRRREAEGGAAASMPLAENLAWEALVHAEVLRELYEGMRRLPPQRQRVIKMLYQDGKSVREVAEELNVSLSAVKQHKKEGLLFLRKILPLLYLLLQFRNP